MARFRKISSFTWLLLTVIILQFIGLLGLLLADSRQTAEGTENADAVETSGDVQPGTEDADMPAWLQPPVPEPVQEKEPPEGALTAQDILSNAQVIAHGMGTMDGITTLNCLEGFQQQYERGVRVFEVDLRLTSDLQVVLRHDWRVGWQAGISETSIPSLKPSSTALSWISIRLSPSGICCC